MAQNVMRSLHQHFPQVGVAFLGDPQLGLALARIAAPGSQAHLTADIATLLKSLFVFHCQHKGKSDQRSDSAHLLQEFSLRIINPGDLLDFVITILDLLCQRGWCAPPPRPIVLG